MGYDLEKTGTDLVITDLVLEEIKKNVWVDITQRSIEKKLFTEKEYSIQLPMENVLLQSL